MVHINELYPDTILRLNKSSLGPAEQYLINYRRQENGLPPQYQHPTDWKRDLYTRLAEQIANELTLHGKEPNVRVYLLDENGTRTETFEDVVRISVEKTTANHFTMAVETDLPSFAESYRKYTSVEEYMNDVISELKKLIENDYLNRTYSWNIQEYLGADTYLEHLHDEVYLGNVLSEMNEQAADCRKEFHAWVDGLLHK